MEGYLNAFRLAIAHCFPDDVLEFILQRMLCTENGKAFNPNTLWPYVYASFPKHIELLLKLGADINHRDPGTGLTPIMYFAQSGKVDSVTYLLERGADITIKNNIGQDVYSYASLSGKVNIDSIIAMITERKANEELMRRNQMLEKQCQEMDGKLNYLMGMFEKMNMGEMVDLTHKKMKPDDN